jgi:outer membrane protein assembly factor BamB
MKKKLLCYGLLIVLLFSSSCQKKQVDHLQITPTTPPPAIDNQVKQPILPIYQPPEKKVDTNFDLSKVPELKIDFTKYPTLDFDKLSEKHYRIVAETDQTIGSLSDRDDWNFCGKYLLIDLHEFSTGFTCIDKDTMKVLWEENGKTLQGVSDNLVFYYENENDNTGKSRIINALDILSGQTKWKQTIEYTTESIFDVFNLLNNEYILVFRDLQKGITFALDSITGNIKWQIPVIIENYELLEDKQIILYKDQQNNLAAIDCKIGKRIWANKDINVKPTNDSYLDVTSLPGDKVFVSIQDGNGILVNSFLLNAINGRLIKNSFNLLSYENTVEISMEGMHSLEEKYNNSFNFYSMKIGSNYYISKFDLLNMKELWRIPVVNWNENYLFHQLWVQEKNPARVYLSIQKTIPDNEVNLSTEELQEGFYEIDFETGKILWRLSNPASYESKVQDQMFILFSRYNYFENVGYLASIDLRDHSIKWALNLKNEQLNRSIPGELLIFQLQKNIGEGKVRDGPLIEFSSIDGKVFAYKDKYDFSEGQCRYGYDYKSGKLYKMEVQK